MPKNNEHEIKLQEGESKKIEINILDIPLTKGIDKPEVKPNLRSESLVDNNLNENEEVEKDEKRGLGPIGEMNKRPERRGIPQEKEERNNQNQEGQSLRTGGNSEKQNFQNEKEQKMDLSNGPDKNNEDQNQSNQNEEIRRGREQGLGLVGEMNKLPGRRDNDREKENQEKNENRSELGGGNLSASWNNLRASIHNKNVADKSSNMAGNIVNEVSRLLSFEFYRLCWSNLISSFGLTYFGLLFLFIIKYVAHSNKIIKFVSIKDELVRSEIIKNKEKTSILMIISFLALTLLVIIVVVIIIIVIMLALKAVNLTIWGLITDSEQFFEDWKIIWEFIKAGL